MADDADAGPAPQLHPHPSSRRGTWLVLGLVGCAIVLGIAASIYRASRPPRPVPAVHPTTAEPAR